MNKLAKTSAPNDVVEIRDEKNIIDLTSTNQIDITNLSKDAQELLTQKAFEAKIDINKKAQEAQIDIQGTKHNLDNLNSTVRESSKDGTSITVTHTQTTSVGRTEVIMGNTQKAAAGKISRSAAGSEDNTMKIVIAIAIIAVVIVLIVK
jgi:hypothetical protein